MSHTDSRTAIVTGASRGIGRAIALELARQGADIVVNYANSNGPAEEVASEIRDLGRRALCVQADIASAEACEQLIKASLDEFGGIDILVNNAGINRDGLALRMKDADFEQVIQTNLTGTFRLCRLAARPMMKRKGGRIVNIASVVGQMGNAGQANYVASKAGLIGLTKSLARELAGRNILVNALAPGFIESDMTAALGEDVRQQMLAQIPLGQFGTPEQVAGAVAFLCSPAAAYITGTTLNVNGGMYM